MFRSRLITLAVIGLLQWQSTVCASLVSKLFAPLGQRNVEKRQVAGTVDSLVFVRRAYHACKSLQNPPHVAEGSHSL